MTKPIDVYFSFRSPYSYLATPELVALPDAYDVQVNLRPVLPLAVRDPEFFSPDNIKRARYIRLDWKRRAEFLGMPSRWPSPDPIVQDMATFKIAAEQPYIHRLTRLGVEAQRQAITIRKSPLTSRRWRNPSTGACPPLPLRVNPSLARIVSTPCVGVLISTA